MFIIVTHIDVTPNFADGANKAIQKYAADSRKDKGAISIEGLVQDGRTNHFTIVEVWQSREAFEAHAGLAALARIPRGAAPDARRAVR